MWSCLSRDCAGKHFLGIVLVRKAPRKNPHPLETPIYGMGTIATCSVVRLQGCHDWAWSIIEPEALHLSHQH